MKLCAFDISYWKNRSTTLILSDNNDHESEKLCNNLIRQYDTLCPLNDVRIVLSPNNHYNDYTTKQYYYKSYDTSALRSIIARQHAMLQYKKERNIDYGANVLLVIDDNHISHDIINSDKNLQYIMECGRMLNITTIIRIPYEKMFQNNNFFRSKYNNVDYIFMFPTQNSKLKIHDLYQQFTNRTNYQTFDNYPIVFSYIENKVFSMEI